MCLGCQSSRVPLSCAMMTSLPCSAVCISDVTASFHWIRQYLRIRFVLVIDYASPRLKLVLVHMRMDMYLCCVQVRMSEI